jgi:Fic family protein
MMSYIELSKLFYRDENQYITEYKSRFNSPDAIKINFNIKENQAFFMQNAQIADLVFQILKTDKRVSLISTQLPGLALEQYKKHCLIDEIVLTNKIEGVHSTRREIASILNDLEDTIYEKSTSRKRFWGLVEQYNRRSQNEPVYLKTCEDIRRLFDATVLAEVIEENPKNAPDGKIFRKDASSVHTVTDKEIHRGTYPESAIISEMEDALAFYNDESIEIIYRIGIFHYLFEYIHPFYDGNGRLGRFIVSNSLSREFNPLLAYRISSTIMENINLYYNAFKTCNDPRNMGDLTPFLIMMLGIIKTSIIELEDALRTRHSRLTNYQKAIALLPNGNNPRTSNAYIVLIQAGLFSEYGISTRAFSKLIESSFATAKKELDFLSSHNLLTRNRIGRENYYLLNLDEVDKMI